MMKRLVVLSVVLIVAALLVAGCTQPTEPTPTPAPTAEPTETPSDLKNIIETAGEAGQFTTLLEAVDAAGLTDTLSTGGPFTVFAPTDDAFAALPEGTLDTLLADPEGQLTQILLYHVADGKVMAEEVVTLEEVATLQGGVLVITVDGSDVMVNDANVIQTDIEASNGVIHVIDGVLLPPEEAGTIMEVLVAEGRFGTLISAIEAAGLNATLAAEGEYTLFAPNDDAFAALPEGTVETLLADPTGELTQVLLFHVVDGEVMAAEVVTLDSAETLQGEAVTIAVDGETVMINEATVIKTDIDASNGVIHEIDAVLLPA